MTPDRDATLVAPALRETWRPFYAHGAIECAVVVIGSSVAIAGVADALNTMAFVSVANVALAGARALVWRLVPGRVRITHDESGLLVERGSRVLRRHPWSGVEQAVLVPGDRWPEWARWAAFTRLEVTYRQAGGRRIKGSPGMLLVDPELVRRGQQDLDRVVRRHLGAPTS